MLPRRGSARVVCVSLRETRGPRNNRGIWFHQSARRLLVTNKETKRDFLVDTGADMCIHVPRTIAANSPIIHTHGLCHYLLWRFIVAVITRRIIGADSFAHCSLLVEVKNSQPIDGQRNYVEITRSDGDVPVVSLVGDAVFSTNGCTCVSCFNP